MKTLKAMKPRANNIDKDLGQDMKTFEQQPTKTKELEILQLQFEKATGQESLTLQKLIQEKSQTGQA